MMGMAVNNRTEDIGSRGTVTVEPLSGMDTYWRQEGERLNWDCLFMLPPWLDAWSSHYGRSLDVRLYVVRMNGAVLGLAPLVVIGDTARLVSDTELIDYSDFVIVPSMEGEFFSLLFGRLGQENISRLEMPRVRAGSAASYLTAYAPEGWKFSGSPIDVLYEMELPDTWEGYLEALSTKERHEVRRKIRRLEGAGRTELRMISAAKEVSEASDIFISLFRSNRSEKAKFMTAEAESFFRSLAAGMADAGLLKFYFMYLDGLPAAAAMCFDYHSSVYLYNNGYDRRFGSLSVGLLSKVFSIRESIKNGRTKYNFLRGSETYKGRLGGSSIDLFQCEARLK